jgi:hypothetical protein
MTISFAKARLPCFSATKVEERTTSRVVTPNRLQICVKSVKIDKRILKKLPLGIVDTVLLENFGNYRNGGIYRVRNNENESFGSESGDTRREIAHNTRVDLVKDDVSMMFKM